MNNKFILIGLVLVVLIGGALYYSNQKPAEVVVNPNQLAYKNSQYGFVLALPTSWKGYSVMNTKIEDGWSVTLRHPQWTTTDPRMDAPILVYTLEQWQKWEATGFEGYHTAAPFGPMERGRNNKYVFATAPRYNYSFATGFEEVETIIQTLKGFNI